MPLIADYDPNEDEQGQGGSGGRRISGTTGTVQATPSKQDEPEFVPWSRFQSANQEVSQREANKLAGNVETQAKGVLSDVDTASKKHQQDIESNYVPTGVVDFKPPPKAERAETAEAAPSSGFAGAVNQALPQQPAQQPAQQTPMEFSPWERLRAADQQVGQWDSAVNAPKPPQALPNTTTAARAIDPKRLKTEQANGVAKTGAGDLAGAKSLEEQLNQGGAGAWEALLGRAGSATQAANALGSDTGVGALLEQQQGALPSSAFDAALIGGEGADRFRELSQQYGGDALGNAITGANEAAQQRWSTLMGDVSTAAAARDAEIQAGNDALSQRIATEQKQKADLDAARSKADEAKRWMEENFPPYAFAQDQQSMLAWMNANTGIHNNANYGLQSYWAKSIYGKDSGMSDSQLMQKLYEDIKRMTAEEYEAFKYGIVPSWMGLGSAASGTNGGGFYGLGNSGQRQVSATGTNDASGLSEEDRKAWEEKMRALGTFYDILNAGMAAFGPVGVAAGAAGRGIQKGTTGV